MNRFTMTRRQLLAAVPLGMAAAAGVGVTAGRAAAVDFQLLYHAAMLANEAYDGTSEILGDNRGAQTFIATPGQTDVQYFIIYNPAKKVQAIAVRGSDNNVNWSLDMDTRGDRDQAAGILLHAGFRQAAEAIWADVRPRLKPGYTTFLTGHSLGGAVAVILGMYMRDAGVKVGGIYTFGQPKVTNLAGAEAYATLPLIRVIYQNDIVPLVPADFSGGATRFAHLGTAVNILEGPYYVYATEAQVFQFSQTSLQTMLTQASVPDHHMKYYLASLKAKFNGAVEVPFSERNKHIVRHGPNEGPTSGLSGTEKKQNFGGSFQ